MAFFRKFFIRCSFFFASEFRFMQICEAFRLEMGQRVGLRKRFIIFRPIPSVFLGQTLDLHIFVLLFNWKWVNEKDSIGDLSFSAKFHRFGLRNGIFLKIFISVVFFFFCIGIQIYTNLCCFSIGNGSTSRTPEEVHRLSTNSIISASEKASFWKFS